MSIPQAEIDFLNLLVQRYWSQDSHLCDIKYVTRDDGRIDIQFACSGGNYYNPDVPLYLQVLHLTYCMDSECDQPVTNELFINLYCKDRGIYTANLVHPEQPLIRYEQELYKTDSAEIVLAKIERLIQFFQRQKVGEVPAWRFTNLPLAGKHYFPINVAKLTGLSEEQLLNKIFDKLKLSMIVKEGTVCPLQFQYHDHLLSTLSVIRPGSWLHWTLQINGEQDTFTQLKKICQINPCDVVVRKVYNHWRFYASAYRADMIGYLIIDGVTDWSSQSMFEYCQWLKTLLL